MVSKPCVCLQTQSLICRYPWKLTYIHVLSLFERSKNPSWPKSLVFTAAHHVAVWSVCFACCFPFPRLRGRNNLINSCLFPAFKWIIQNRGFAICWLCDYNFFFSPTAYILEKLHDCCFFDDEVQSSMFYLTLHDAMLSILEKHPETMHKKSGCEKVKKCNNI